MSEQELENQNSLNTDEELNLELENEEEQGEGSVNGEVNWELKAKELEAKNKQLYARIKKGEQKVEKPQPNSTTDDLSDIRETVSKLSLSEKKRQFGYEYNLSPEETDAVFRLNPNPDKKTLEDPFIKGGLEAIRAKKRVEGAIPSSTGKVPTVNGKTWSQMTPEERKSNFPSIMAKRK